LKQTRILTISLVLLLVIAFTYLMMDYARQQKKQAVLVDQIENAEFALSLIPAPSAVLKQQLADVEAANARVSKAISDNSLNSTGIINTLLFQADSCNLKVAPLTTESWAYKKIGDSEYKILPVKLQIQGPLNGLIDFIKMIDNSPRSPNLLILEMNILNDTKASTAGGLNSDSVTANLSLAIVVRLNSTPPEPVK
jgi:hypothetical protein